MHKPGLHAVEDAEYPHYLTCKLTAEDLHNATKVLYKSDVDYFYVVKEIEKYSPYNRTIMFMFKHEHDKLLFALRVRI